MSTNINDNQKEIQKDSVIKVLMIGNSHGVDATRQLGEIFKAAAPGQKFIIGALYHSGCRIDQHLTYIAKNEGNYIYYKTDETMSKWTRTPKHIRENGVIISGERDDGQIACGATFDQALKDQEWDFITLQQMSTYAAYDQGEFNFDQMDELIDYVRTNAAGNPKIYWFDTWAHPNDDIRVATYCGIGYGSRWYNQHLNYFGLSQHTMYNMLIANVKEKILPRVANGQLAGVIDTATAIQYAQDVKGLAEHQVFRDGTHISDFGRVMIAALWYSVFTGDVLTVDDLPDEVIEPNDRSLYPADGKTITAQMKQDVVDILTYVMNPENAMKLPAGAVEPERIQFAEYKDGVWACGNVVADLYTEKKIGDVAVESVVTARDNAVTIKLMDYGDIVLDREGDNLMRVTDVSASIRELYGIDIGAVFAFQTN